jgi:PAS domain S-box-containing protein/putative nucleotidyltransferase with HDIG domain
MASEILNNDSKTKFQHLEWLIIGMAGCTLASLQIIHFVFFSLSTYPSLVQSVFDWLFSMAIIGGLVHFSFREILKINHELIVKKEQASKAEGQMQHIIDNSQDAIFLLNEQGNFIFASRSAENLMGYKTEELVKLNIENIVSDDYRNYIKKLIGQSLDFSGRHIYIDFKKWDGALTPVEISFIPVMDYNTGIYNYQGIARDVTERKALEVAQKEKEHYLQTIARVGQILVEPNSNLPFEDIIKIAGEASKSTTAFVNITDSDVLSKLNLDRIVEWCAEGYKNSPIEEATIDKAVGLAASDMQEGGPGEETDGGTLENNTMASILFPLTIEGKYVGVIGFNRLYESDNWKAEHVNLLNSCTNMVSQAIEKQIAATQLKTYFISLAKTISSVLFVVDPFTASHQQRLAEMVCMVGERMGLNPKQIEWLYFCGLLHDIGKAAIPGTILSKPGQLTDEEWVLMRSHVKRGYEMLKGMNLPDYAVDMVLHHHERVDGSGYPDGLKGDKLSLESKILGICDVVEAMGSHRPYRPARKMTEIIDELNQGKGTKYDYGLVEMMVEMLEHGELGSSFMTRPVVA